MSKSNWWVISGEDLQKMLYRVQNGEDADTVYIEHWANSGHEQVEGNDDD